MADLHETIAKAVPQIERGKVWCIACGRMQRVDGADALRNGWPKCCGSTMTIDSPEWRAAHASGVRAVDEAQLPHAHGHAVCDDCGHRWVAVWPLAADALECPKCHSTNTDREAQ